MELNISQKQQKTKVAIITAVVAFITIFLVSGWVMSTVYGAEIPETYDETLEITKNATESTEGYEINIYIDNVKQDICKTLVNATEYEKCLEL